MINVGKTGNNNFWSHQVRVSLQIRLQLEVWKKARYPFLDLDFQATQYRLGREALNKKSNPAKSSIKIV